MFLPFYILVSIRDQHIPVFIIHASHGESQRERRIIWQTPFARKFSAVCKLRNRFALYLSMKSVYNKIEANILKGGKGCGCSKR